jgi:AraC-like DNA-binding protein
VALHYWTGRWDLPDDAPHVNELISDPCVNFVLEEGGKHAGNRLVGVWTRLWIRKLEGRGRVVGVKLRSGAVRAFSKHPACGFTNRIVSLESVFGRRIAVLEREVLGADSDESAFALFTEWLVAARVPDESGAVALAVALVDRIAKDREIVSVDRLADAAGLGVRAVQRLFREHVGAPPKWVIQRHRLQEVALKIETGEATNLAALAADLGYADQAHLARDFKRVVGKTPREFGASILA